MSIYLDYEIQVGCLKSKICAKQDTYPRQQVSIVMLPTTLNGKLPGLSPLGGSCVPSEEPREQRSNAVEKCKEGGRNRSCLLRPSLRLHSTIWSERQSEILPKVITSKSSGPQPASGGVSGAGNVLLQ